MNDKLLPIESPSAAAEQLQGQSFISAEFIYKPRPPEGRERQVFDFTLASRLSELSRYENAAVVFICRDQSTEDSLAYLCEVYPRLKILFAQVNPEPIAASPRDPYADTPRQCGWESPENWQRYDLTDRRARVTFTLDMARPLTSSGFIIFPAHDAVWSTGLLARSVPFSQRHP